ncbi:MAG: S1C family serine protease [Syntrophobacteraceae bacterium]
MKKIILYIALGLAAFILPQAHPARADIWSAATIEKVQRATVTIYILNETGKPIAQGSGFFFQEAGHVVTNYHVLGKAAAAVVKTYNGTLRKVEAIIAKDGRDDLVEATVEPGRTPAVCLRPADTEPKVGDPLMVVGSPLNLAKVTSKGNILEIVVMPKLGKCIVHDARAFHGSSGSPVVNPAGEVIGIETAGVVSRPDMDYAIPVARFSGMSSCYRELKTPGGAH